MKIEFKFGRKVVKTFDNMDDTNLLLRKLLAVRNDDSAWEIGEYTMGNNVEIGLIAAFKMEELLGKVVDVFDSLTIWVNGIKVRRVWSKGF
ncbi:MAG: hypothetical protein QGH26_04160 [Candidatus Pacebacteria bacterium]|jgi:hypothetical protein|nr:hypothetical protein [Candidatus Paceibacterota bacterium]|tara:strand:- start:613 stop:885 length:273 start_codon:yes stop_codon:yes gene_type:complete